MHYLKPLLILIVFLNVSHANLSWAGCDPCICGFGGGTCWDKATCSEVPCDSDGNFSGVLRSVPFATSDQSEQINCTIDSDGNVLSGSCQ
jgi:hypothetical protein